MPIRSTSYRSRSRGLVAALVVPIVLPVLLGGCGAGAGAQTLQPYQAAEGTNADSGSLGVRNLLVLADGADRVVHGTIVNKGTTADELVGIVPDPAEEGVKIAGVKNLPLPADTAVRLPPAAGKPGTVTGAEPGEMVKVTLTFESAAPITISIPVLAEDHYSPSPSQQAGH